MPVEPVAQKFSTKDVQLNTVLGDYKRKINEIIDALGIGGENGGVGVHAPAHHLGGADPLVFASIAGFSDYLDQPVKIASTPEFAGIKLAPTDFYLGAGATGSKLHTLQCNEFYGDYGSATDPSYTFTSDQDTGMYRYGANQLAFCAGGAISFLCGADYLMMKDGDTLRLGNSSDFRMWHDGTNHYFRSYKHGVNLYVQLENASGTNKTLATFDPDAIRVNFTRIHLSQSTLNFEGGSSGIRSGTIYGDTTGNAATLFISSDYKQIKRSTSAKKYKDKVKDLELDSSLIYNLRPVSYNSICEGDGKRRFHGLIADEIEQYYPEIINYNKGEVENYDNSMLMTLMLAEEQKLYWRMNNLEQRVKELEKKYEKN